MFKNTKCKNYVMYVYFKKQASFVFNFKKFISMRRKRERIVQFSNYI